MCVRVCGGVFAVSVGLGVRVLVRVCRCVLMHALHDRNTMGANLHIVVHYAVGHKLTTGWPLVHGHLIGQCLSTALPNFS